MFGKTARSGISALGLILFGAAALIGLAWATDSGTAEAGQFCVVQRHGYWWVGEAATGVNCDDWQEHMGLIGAEPLMDENGHLVPDSLPEPGWTFNPAFVDYFTTPDISPYLAVYAEPPVITAPTVSALSISSDPGPDDTYGLGDAIQVAVTFSEAVDVSGSPRLTIDMDPARWGAKWATYAGGSGTTTLTFSHTVVAPNYSSRGIAVLAQTLELNGGTVRSASDSEDAALWHLGLDHDANHRVDWQTAGDSSGSEGGSGGAGGQTGDTTPTVTGVEVTSDAGADGTYRLGNVIRITVKFSEAVNVSGTPQLTIDMDPAAWGAKWRPTRAARARLR